MTFRLPRTLSCFAPPAIPHRLHPLLSLASPAPVCEFALLLELSSSLSFQDLEFGEGSLPLSSQLQGVL